MRIPDFYIAEYVQGNKLVVLFVADYRVYGAVMALEFINVEAYVWVVDVDVVVEAAGEKKVFLRVVG